MELYICSFANLSTKLKVQWDTQPISHQTETHFWPAWKFRHNTHSNWAFVLLSLQIIVSYHSHTCTWNSNYIWHHKSAKSCVMACFCSTSIAGRFRDSPCSMLLHLRYDNHIFTCQSQCKSIVKQEQNVIVRNIWSDLLTNIVLTKWQSLLNLTSFIKQLIASHTAAMFR